VRLGAICCNNRGALHMQAMKMPLCRSLSGTLLRQGFMLLLSLWCTCHTVQA
jgi:hypothetical protein